MSVFEIVKKKLHYKQNIAHILIVLCFHKRILKINNSISKFFHPVNCGWQFGNCFLPFYASLSSSVSFAETRTACPICDCLPQTTFVKTFIWSKKRKFWETEKNTAIIAEDTYFIIRCEAKTNFQLLHGSVEKYLIMESNPTSLTMTDTQHQNTLLNYLVSLSVMQLGNT